MRRELPERPNLEHLKAQAKDLLESFRRKEPSALERVREALPAARGADDAALVRMELALHDAQSVLAREYGFASWAELRTHVESAPLTAETLRALMARHTSTPLPEEVQRAMIAAAAAERPSAELASPLPLVAVRNAVLPVGALAPLNIGRPESVASIEAAREGAKVLALFTQRDAASEAPGEADLHPVGCAAHLHAVLDAEGGGRWIVVRALRWIRLEGIERGRCQMARIAPFNIEQGDTAEVQRLEQTLRARMRAFAATLPDPTHLLRRVEAMSALELADVAMANLPCPVEDKARYAGCTRLTERLEEVLALLDRAS